MKVPQNWNQITVGTYQAIFKALSMPGTHTQELTLQHIQLLMAATGMSDTQINTLPLADFKKALNNLQWLWDIQALEKEPLHPIIKLGGLKYRVTLEVSKLTGGQFIDLTSFTKHADTNVSQLHNIIAVLLTAPGKKYDGSQHAAIAARVQQEMPITAAYPIAVFFLNHLTASSYIIATCLQHQMRCLQHTLTHQQKRITSIGTGL